MEIEHFKEVKEMKKLGTASTLQARGFIKQYADRVEKFIRDNANLGVGWQVAVARRLYNFKGVDTPTGELLGSSTDMGVAIATFFPEIDLITGQQLLDLYKKVGNQNPFGHVYVDFGVYINGMPVTNSFQARTLLESLKKDGINLGDGLVINFSLLRLNPSPDVGLVYKLAEGVRKELAPVSDYNFCAIGKNGLFRAYLCASGWCFDRSDLDYSTSNGRLVRYNAEGVVQKKLEPFPDITAKLKDEFLTRFR